MTDEVNAEAAAEAPLPPTMVDCVILRDFWDNDGERHRAGEEVRVPVNAAFEGIEKGILARAKPNG